MVLLLLVLHEEPIDMNSTISLKYFGPYLVPIPIPKLGMGQMGFV